ncbi:MAG: hypothetical protein HY549_11340 [Elusimicrobia bacterium]|nr:hypothetical protein [Elusimicrobiota bacterium]
MISAAVVSILLSVFSSPAPAQAELALDESQRAVLDGALKDALAFRNKKPVPGLASTPNLIPAQAPGAGEAAELRLLRRAGIHRFTEDFRELEDAGYEIKVQACEFFAASPSTILLQVRKLPGAQKTATRTEALLGARFEARVKELESGGRRVEVVCFKDMPYAFGAHAVIQHR